MRTIAATVLASALLLQDALSQVVITPTIVVTTHVSLCKASTSGLPTSKSTSAASIPSSSSNLISPATGTFTSASSALVKSSNFSSGSSTLVASSSFSPGSSTLVASSASSSASSSAVPVCGQPYSGSNGTEYQIECGQTYGGQVIPQQQSVRFINRHSYLHRKRQSDSSFQACISTCDDLASCVAAAFADETCTLLASIDAIVNTPGAQAAIRATYAETVLPLIANPSTTSTSSLPAPTVTTATQAYSSAIADHISQRISENAPVSTSDQTAVYVTPDPVSSTSSSSVPAVSSLVSDYVSQHLSGNAPVSTSQDTIIYITESTLTESSTSVPGSSISVSESSTFSFLSGSSASVSSGISVPSTSISSYQPSNTGSSLPIDSTSSGSASASGAASVYVDRRAAIASSKKKSSSLHKSTSSKHKTSLSVKKSSSTHKSSSTAHKSSSTPVVQAKILSTKKSTTSVHKVSTAQKVVKKTTSTKKTTSSKKTSSSKKATSTKKAKSTKKPTSTKKATSTKKSTSAKKASSTKKITSSASKVTAAKKITTSKKTSTTSSKKTSTSSKKSSTSSKHTSTSSVKKTSTSSKKTSSTSSKKPTSTSSKKTTALKSSSTAVLKASVSLALTLQSTSTSSSQLSSSSSSSTTSSTSSSTSSSSSSSLRSTTTSSSVSSSTSSSRSTTSTASGSSSSSSSRTSSSSSSQSSSTSSSRSSTLLTSTRTSSSVSSSSTKSSSSTSAVPTYVTNTGKRGLAYNQANLTLPFSQSGQNSQVSWAYDWYYAPCSSDSDTCAFNPALEFVPLLYNNDPSLLAAWPTAAQLAIENGSTALMSFNEPDFCISGSACMDIQTAVSAYQQYMQPFAGKALLGAPAVTNSGSTDDNPMGLQYLEYFIGNCTNCTIDFINLHWYSNKYAGASYLESHINSARTIAPGLPIWITEFGLDSTYSYTDAELQSFLQTAMPWLDQQDDVHRYAYFMDAPGILIDAAGDGISGTGSVYNNFTNATVQADLY